MYYIAVSKWCCEIHNTAKAAKEAAEWLLRGDGEQETLVLAVYGLTDREEKSAYLHRLDVKSVAKCRRRTHPAGSQGVTWEREKDPQTAMRVLPAFFHQTMTHEGDGVRLHMERISLCNGNPRTR